MSEDCEADMLARSRKWGADEEQLLGVNDHTSMTFTSVRDALAHIRRWRKAVDTSLVWASSLFELEVDVTPRTPLFSAFAACSEGVKRCYAFRPLDEKGCCPRQCPGLPSHDIVVNLRKATPHLRLVHGTSVGFDGRTLSIFSFVTTTFEDAMGMGTDWPLLFSRTTVIRISTLHPLLNSDHAYLR
jgi:hypothetical protein